MYSLCEAVFDAALAFFRNEPGNNAIVKILFWLGEGKESIRCLGFYHTPKDDLGHESPGPGLAVRSTRST